MIHWRDTTNGYLEYMRAGARSHTTVHVWRGDLEAISDVCSLFDEETRVNACQRLANENYSYRNLQQTLAALRRGRDHIVRTQADVDPDDYLDLLTAIEDLEGILRRIEAL